MNKSLLKTTTLFCVILMTTINLVAQKKSSKMSIKNSVILQQDQITETTRVFFAPNEDLVHDTISISEISLFNPSIELLSKNEKYGHEILFKKLSIGREKVQEVEIYDLLDSTIINSKYIEKTTNLDFSYIFNYRINKATSTLRYYFGLEVNSYINNINVNPESPELRPFEPEVRNKFALNVLLRPKAVLDLTKNIFLEFHIPITVYRYYRTSNSEILSRSFNGEIPRFITTTKVFFPNRLNISMSLGIKF